MLLGGMDETSNSLRGHSHAMFEISERYKPKKKRVELGSLRESIRPGGHPTLIYSISSTGFQNYASCQHFAMYAILGRCVPISDAFYPRIVHSGRGNPYVEYKRKKSLFGKPSILQSSNRSDAVSVRR